MFTYAQLYLKIKFFTQKGYSWAAHFLIGKMDPPGFEPGTPALQRRYSNHWTTGPKGINKNAISRIKIIGGDPSAGSPTGTLWRLNPPHWTLVRINQKTDPHQNPARLAWRAVCARLVDVFTGPCWNPITRNSIVMRASYSPQSELR